MDRDFTPVEIIGPLQPVAQIEVTDGHDVIYLDMGWEQPLVASRTTAISTAAIKDST